MQGERGTAGESLAKTLRRADEALQESARAGQDAIRGLVDTGREVSQRELQRTFDSVQKIEEQVIATVGQVAESASERVPGDIRDLAGRSARAGTETTREAAAAMTGLSKRLAATSVELGLTCMEFSSELGVRCTQIAGAWLTGWADALDRAADIEDQRKDKPAAEVRAAAEEAKKSP